LRRICCDRKVRFDRCGRPIDKGSTPSYLSVNSPVSVGPLRLTAACPEPDMLQ